MDIMDGRLMCGLILMYILNRRFQDRARSSLLPVVVRVMSCSSAPLPTVDKVN